MLFSGISFLYFFLPVVLALYFILPARFRNYVLLVSSLLFYAWGEPKYILLMVVTILLGYGAGLLLERANGINHKRIILSVAVFLCLLSLAVFKYTDFAIGSFNALTGQEIPLIKLALPIGISFYTFQLISYLVDVYRGEAEAQKNPICLAVYISMFPQLIAGPIVRYSEISQRLADRTCTLQKVSDGIGRFCIGLSKKVLIANTLGELSAVYSGLSQPTVLFTWLYAISITLQLYFDFSGYSDMAIGLGSILGFEFPENFRHPFLSRSATEFWRRWHITLGSWFRDYLYIPLGGSRVKPARHLFNILVVWMATGLWHGANWNFVLWGLYFAVLLVIEKYGVLKLLEKHRLLSHIYLLLAVIISFIIFDSPGVADGFHRVGALFGASGLPLSSADSLFYLKDYLWLLLIACIGATELPVRLAQKIRIKCPEGVLTVAEPLFYLVLLVLSTASIINGSFNPFLYFRF